ncbi:MAG TPA: BACON domain-containing carbohydrate-binding protein [Anaerolineaceae bacterium]
MRRTLSMLFILSLVLSFLLQPAASPAKAEPSAPTAPTAPSDVPVPLVPAGNVSSFSLMAPKLFWNTGVPLCPPALPTGGLAPDATYPETIKRIATYGSTVRTIYSNLVNCSSGLIQSKIVSDADFVYWLTPNGLYRTSTNANPGDAPQLVNSLLTAPGELAMAADKVFAFYTDPFSPSPKVGYVTKDTKALIMLTAPPTGLAFDLQTDGAWVYYRVGTSLYRLKPGIDVGTVIATGVSGYYPEGSRLISCTLNPPSCFFSNNIYIAKGASIFRYNNNNNSLGSSIFTSSDTSATITQAVTDSINLFFVERRTLLCLFPPCFTNYSFVLNRTTRSGANLAALYTYGPTFGSGITGLTTDGTYLFFSPEDGSLQRLANNASALPSINMVANGMEVTQGIQNLSNSVILIKNKRTFVRLYVKSAGAAVAGVTAQLDAPDLGLGPLAPVNPVGTSLTVRATPDRNDINQSFLFELPWTWTQYSSIKLRVTLNPYKVPLEPNYADDVNEVTVSFLDSPSLSVEFFRLNYTLGGVTYKPRIFDDIQKTYSWILRAYPLGGAVGDKFKPRIWDVAGGTQLGILVNQSDPQCKLVYSQPTDDVALCASYFANGWLYYYRMATALGALNIGLNPNAFYYGMISDAAGFFPRGQAMYTKTSVGPSGIPGSGNWDTDGSYADWYAAHEIGHSLGRAHPNAGSDDPASVGVYENCGHSRSDPSYPYGNTSTARAPIGPADNSMEGFDAGDPMFGIKMAVLPSLIWNDVMSYCSNQWISDYTYTNMSTYMTLNPSSDANVQPTTAQLSGDFLVVAGAINTAANTAGFSFIRRVNIVNAQPIIPAGAYALRLLDSSNNPLGADQPITTTSSDVPNIQNFGRVITFQPGARKLQLVRVADGVVLATHAISANAPTVSNVALAGAPNPVSGLVTLNWTANDADGDPLTFDVQYTRDNGVTFQPIANNLTVTTAQIDTAQLGGSGAAKLRVIASDGVNSGFGDSATFVMANKPPQPFVLDPANNLHIHYGQLVNFNGMALDAQDSTVAASGLTWKDSLSSVLGTGPLLSLDSLPVGTDVITLQATNSKGLTATTTVTVVVDDNLDLPGPTLSAGPSQVGWDVPVGTTALQTSSVSITNTGSGDLPWTATSSAPWLHLSSSSGTVTAAGDPSTLTLSTDPTGLPSGSMRSAQVTITAASQTATIMVSLSVGPVRLVSNVSPSFLTFYIPLINK